MAGSIDLSSHRYGARTEKVLPRTSSATREEKWHFFGGPSNGTLGSWHLELHELEYLKATVAEQRTSCAVVRRMTDAEENFAAYGTACAGLIVGEAALVRASGSVAMTVMDAKTHPNVNLLPYFGVDPHSKLISIRTSPEADPDQFMAAFLYAWSCNLDVIVCRAGCPTQHARLCSRRMT